MHACVYTSHTSLAHGLILLAEFMIATEQGDLLRIHSLERKQQRDALELVSASVDKIAIENLHIPQDHCDMISHLRGSGTLC
jgi:hypothetical protein